VTNDAGHGRLHDPEDFVHIEIRTALNRKIRIIPALVGGARMPTVQDLPAPLTPLARRQAVEITDINFRHCVSRLIEGLDAALTEAEQPLSSPVVSVTRLNPKDRLTYVWIPPGKFTMGCSPEDDEAFDDEKPARDVTITKGFWIGQTPVTQEAYQRVMGKNPSDFKGATMPVESITWFEANEYCRAVGGRLPTEAEWEYAARAGDRHSRYGELESVAWYRHNSEQKTHEVGQMAPNAWGLYDTLGNVSEWTSDWYADNLPSAFVDPAGPPNGQHRALRGGSWCSDSRGARVSLRDWGAPGGRYFNFGFRCVGELGPL
jgi:formylglycine-generating enzyme required for sulfatase activity